MRCSSLFVATCVLALMGTGIEVNANTHCRSVVVEDVGTWFDILDSSGTDSSIVKDVLDNNTVYSDTYKGVMDVSDEVFSYNCSLDSSGTISEDVATVDESDNMAWVIRDVMGMSNEYGMGNSITYLKRGTTVELLEPYKTGYLKVSHNGSVSYVYSDCLSLKKIKDLLNISYSDDSISDSYSDTINSEVSILPSKLLNDFIDSYWTVEVTNEDIGAKYTNGKFSNVKGLTMYKNRVIYLSSSYDVSDSVLHEFGHWVDMEKGFISTSNKFNEIYTSESELFKDTFNVTFYYDNMELFAESFYRYFVNPDVLEANCPKIYKFMSDIVSSYE